VGEEAGVDDGVFHPGGLWMLKNNAQRGTGLMLLPANQV
jgi:hypothetical protein